MVMTPLHMDQGGSTLRVIGFVISVHVLGMYFFSPLVGVLVDRFGSAALLMTGAVVFWVALLLAGSSPTGTSARVTIGLLLLGLGWSACTIAASALITAQTPLRYRTDVQGTADLLMNVSAGVAGALSGVLVALTSFAGLNLFAALLALGVVLAARTVVRSDPSPRSTNATGVGVAREP